MKKRKFVKLLTTGTASLLGASLFWSCQNTPDGGQRKILSKELLPEIIRTAEDSLPKNWIWIRPKLGLSDEEWKKTFDQIKSSGIDAIIPQVYAGVETLFDHPTLPVKERWLEHILPLAHAAGLEVHAWMWTMPMNNKELIEKHPDWFAVNGNGEPAHTHPAYVNYYKFMDPCHPEVQDFVAANVAALAKIEDLDGIHLDYVRLPDVILAEALQPKYNIVQHKEYPEYDYSYSERCRQQFKAKHGIDPMDLEDPSANKDWFQFRCDAISHIVNERCVPLARESGKRITAAVFPNWESVRQQWHRWDLDAFLPMLYHGFYNQSVEWIGEETKKGLERLKNTKPIYSGLFIPHLRPDEIQKAIDVSKKAGAKGVCLFAYGSIKAEHWAEVQKSLKI